MKWVSVLGGLACAAALCGGSGGGCGGGSGGSTGGGSTGGGSGGGTSGGGTTGGAQPYGGFVIFGVLNEAGVAVYSGQAGFYATYPPFSCAGGTQQGSCCYETAAAAQAFGKTVPAPSVPAGAVTLLDGTATLANLHFVSGTGYSPASSTQSNTITWNPGDSLGVTVAGDPSGVAAFSATVTAPAPLAGVSPTLATLASLSRTSDFTLSWTGSPPGTVTLNLDAVSTSGSDGEIICSAPGGSGSLDVAAALLGNFQSGDHASLLLTVANQVSPTVANASVGVSAENQVQVSTTVQ
ncbi:MAG TPA: hypothetical protein VMB50_13780 [Myxococcales bacterium]|nr:hypothetical protein [Myxococcales bacterium]